MITIIMRGKSITCNSDSIINQYETNIDKIKCIIPKKVNEVDLSNCDITLIFKDEFGNGGGLLMNKEIEDYNNDYIQFSNYINSNFTQYSGKISVWLKVIDVEQDVLFETSECFVIISPSKTLPKELTQVNSNYFDQMLIKMNQVQNKTLKLQNDIIDLSNKMRSELFITDSD